MLHSQLTILLAFLGLFVFSCPVQAQKSDDHDEPVRVELNDGSSLIGTVISKDDDHIVFRTTGGVESTIPHEQIRSTEELAGRIIDGRYVRFDPNRTRLFFAPTARPLQQGHGYFAAYEVFFPFVSYGATNMLSLAGGMSLIPTAPLGMFYIAPKVTVLQEGTTDVALGTFVGTVRERFSEDTAATFGVLYGMTTLGSEVRALSVGLGFAFAEGEVSSSPVVMLGGETQLSNSIKLVSENYILFSEPQEPLLSGGVRFFGEQLAADFGLFTTPSLLERGGFPFFPWLGFAYNFR